MGVRRIRPNPETGVVSVSYAVASGRAHSPAGIVEHQLDVVPTVDDEEPVASYRDWNPEDTKIIVYRYGTHGKLYKYGTEVKDKAAALSACKERHGRILVANYTPGRAFFRVFKERK